jgi:hypothetical protein
MKQSKYNFVSVSKCMTAYPCGAPCPLGRSKARGGEWKEIINL